MSAQAGQDAANRIYRALVEAGNGPTIANMLMREAGICLELRQAAGQSLQPAITVIVSTAVAGG